MAPYHSATLKSHLTNITCFVGSNTVTQVYSYGHESMTGSPLVDARKNWLQRQLSRVESFRSTSSSSSLFNRNRPMHPHAQSNGGNSGLSNERGHRMSLYEKLMNRRSSKENRNSPRVPPSRATNNGNGSLFGGKENMSNLMPHPQSRYENSIFTNDFSTVK